MMVAPFDYTSAFGQQGGPFGGLMQGLQAGAQLAQIDERRVLAAAQAEEARVKAAAQQAALDRQQQIGNAMNALLAKPNRTSDDYEAVAVLLPEKEANSLRAGFETRTKEQQQNMLTMGVQAMAAFDAGDKETGLRILRDRATAERNIGRTDQADAYETWARLAEVNPNMAGATIGTLVARLPGGKETIDGYTKVRDERRTAAKEPLVVAELQAKVDEAQIKLRRLDAIQQAELIKAESVAERERIQAKFAERLAKADLDLKGAQAAAQQATTRKTNEEINEIKRKASEGPTPVFNQQLGGFVVAPTAQNPSGDFIPLNKAVSAKDQRSALKALEAAGYNPETGEDRVSKLIEKSTSGRLQSMTAATLGAVDITTPGMKAINELAATANTITLQLLDGKLGAGISNTDREAILGTLGDVANPNKTAGERLAGWTAAKNRMIVSGMLPPPTKPPRANPRSTGQVTPQPTAPTRPGLQNLSNEELLRQLGVTPARP